MRSALPLLAGLILLGGADAQTSQPKPPTAPKAPAASGQAISGSDATSQIVLMRTAQEARDNLRSAMAVASAPKTATRATSNPCERSGRGASLSCIDGIKRSLARAGLTAADRTALDQELTVLRTALLDVQSAGPAAKRAARLTEAQTRADRIDGHLAKLTEPKAAPKAVLPLDKLIPGLSLGD